MIHSLETPSIKGFTVHRSFIAQCPEGIQLDEAISEATNHWYGESIYSFANELFKDEDVVSIEPEIAFRKKIKFRYGGELQPSPFSLD